MFSRSIEHIFAPVNNSSTLSSLIRKQPLLAYHIDNLGIDYIAVQDVRVNEIKAKQPETFSRLLEEFHQDSQEIVIDDLMSSSIDEIVNHLRTSHHDYLKNHLPFVNSLVDYFCKNHDAELELLERFSAYQSEFMKHLELEEKVLFPYVEQLESTLNDLPSLWKVYQVLQSYSIEQFERCHSDIEEQFSDLKDELLNRLASFSADIQFEVIKAELEAIEKDLCVHAEIEDDILVSLSRQIEETLLRRVDVFSALN